MVNDCKNCVAHDICATGKYTNISCKKMKELYDDISKEIMDKVKSIILDYTHYDVRDDVTFMDNVNVETVFEDLDELIDREGENKW